MKLPIRTLIAIAIGAALAAPVALAQNANANVNAGARVEGAAQVPDPVPAADRAIDRTNAAVQDRTDTAQQATERAQDKMQDSTAQTDDVDDTQDTQETPPAPPTQAQGSANAAAHASVTQRDLWNRLDADKDGSISATEADADADFDGRFAAIDSDGNGSVSDAEYNSYAKTNLATSGEHAAGQSQASTESVWANFDQDDDGKLSATEVEADVALKGSFSAMDEDDDGFVTQGEYRDYAAANSKPDDDEAETETP